MSYRGDNWTAYEVICYGFGLLYVCFDCTTLEVGIVTGNCSGVTNLPIHSLPPELCTVQAVQEFDGSLPRQITALSQCLFQLLVSVPGVGLYCTGCVP